MASTYGDGLKMNVYYAQSVIRVCRTFSGDGLCVRGLQWLEMASMAGEGVYLQHSSQCVMFTQSTSVVLVNVWHQSQFTVIEVLLICCLIHSASAVNSDI